MTETGRKIIEKLDEWKMREGNLPRLLELYRGMVEIQSQVRGQIKPLELDMDDKTISHLISSGKPLVEFNDIAIDWNLFFTAFLQISQLIKSYPELSAENFIELRDGSDLKELTRSWFNNETMTESQISMIVHVALKPFLEACRDAVIGSFNIEQWRRGYCPVCGGMPDIAFLEKENGAKWLLCSRCDARWIFQRLECPYCGNNDQDTLAYFTDDQELYRLYVCERCNSYIKAIDLRKTEDEVILPLERYFTIDLDSQAQSKGYSIRGRAVIGGNTVSNPI
ncbi:formate dehydrogenase accessory protein FdhE [Chloroflexota bacterium]